MTKPIVFYDIASGPPVTSYAPNPWKTRYALNIKGVNYETKWVELIDVEKVRKSLDIAPVRKHMDGSDFYTLPVITDPLTGAVVGDSYDIAVYLDDTYPDAPTLISKSAIGETKAFNSKMDALFTNHVVLCCQGMPFNPETAEKTKALHVSRIPGVARWEDLYISDEERVKTMERFCKATEDVAALYSPKSHEGPFIEGASVSYADAIVGGWLQFFKRTIREYEWEAMKGWNGGLFGKLFTALEKYAQIK